MNNDTFTLLIAIGSIIVTPALFVLIIVLVEKYHKKSGND
jgi:hypothetical protein